jgi:hypothetical protein
VQTLRRAAAELGIEIATVVADYVEKHLLANWLALPQLARYNQTYLIKKRHPRQAFADVLGRLAEEEAALVSEFYGAFA